MRKYPDDFLEELKQIVYERYIVLCLYVALPAYLFYIVYDFIISRPFFPEFLGYRLGICAFILIFVFLVKKRVVCVFFAVFLCAGVFAWTISYMGSYNKETALETYFHNGNLQVLIGALAFVPWWRKSQFITMASLVLSAYYLYRPFLDEPLSNETLISKICFDLFVIIISFYLNKIYLESKYREYQAKKALANELSSRESIIAQQVKQITDQQMHLRANELEVENTKRIANLASQVAHDIRSPLTALNLVLNDLSSVSEDKRTLVRHAVQRINDISNNLLLFRRKLYRKSEKDGERPREQSPTIASAVLEAVVSEKRSILSEKHIDLKIQTNHAYPPVFLNFDSVALANSLSNFLQNAIEASNHEGSISISLTQADNQANITVKDNGHGIPDHIINRLGSEPITFGKNSGNGLGVYNSVQRLREQGGNVEFQSDSNGTTVIVSIPTAQSPTWLASFLELTAIKKIVVVDDDTSIHDVWKNRIKTVPMIHFFRIEDAKKWLLSNSIDSTFFLIDFEFAKDELVGLDLIKGFQLQDKCYLVTSRYEEEFVLKSCLKHNIKIIPKFLAGVFPIN